MQVKFGYTEINMVGNFLAKPGSNLQPNYDQVLQSFETLITKDINDAAIRWTSKICTDAMVFM